MDFRSFCTKTEKIRIVILRPCHLRSMHATCSNCWVIEASWRGVSQPSHPKCRSNRGPTRAQVTPRIWGAGPIRSRRVLCRCPSFAWDACPSSLAATCLRWLTLLGRTLASPPYKYKACEPCRGILENCHFWPPFPYFDYFDIPRSPGVNFNTRNTPRSAMKPEKFIFSVLKLYLFRVWFLANSPGFQQIKPYLEPICCSNYYFNPRLF